MHNAWRARLIHDALAVLFKTEEREREREREREIEFTAAMLGVTGKERTLLCARRRLSGTGY